MTLKCSNIIFIPICRLHTDRHAGNSATNATRRAHPPRSPSAHTATTLSAPACHPTNSLRHCTWRQLHAGRHTLEYSGTRRKEKINTRYREYQSVYPSRLSTAIVVLTYLLFRPIGSTAASIQLFTGVDNRDRDCSLQSREVEGNRWRWR